jgi:hypothetical protein
MSALRAEGALALTARPPRPRLFSSFEFWPGALFYAPMVLHWLGLALRHRSLTLPSIANPLIEAGGLCGESKLALFAQFGPQARAVLAPYVGFTRRAGEDSDAQCSEACAAMQAAGLGFPVVAKPDIGCRGAGVQRIRDPAGLRRYLESFPGGARLVLQRLVKDEGEAGIFYVRKPGEKAGRIVSITLKYFPSVIGDGRATLEALIRRDPRAGPIAHLYLPRHADRLARVLAPGERLPLVFAGNHCRGAVFKDGTALATNALAGAIERIARDVPEFHFGRFDLRFASLRALLRGEGFTLIEVNGAGSEATHIWDKDAALLDAYRSLIAQFSLAFAIGAANRRRGFRPIGPLALMRAWRREKRLMRRYPLTE